MKVMMKLAIALLAALLLAAPVPAQEGHPLTGTWSGDWGPTLSERHHLTVVMRWDGDRITGIINPGPDSVPIGDVFLDVADWSVRIEAEATDETGRSIPIRAEGQLEDLESYHRTLTGTWSQGSTTGDFRLTRD